MGSRPAVLAYLIAAASCFPSATRAAISSAGALSFLSARSLPEATSLAFDQARELFHVSCMWSGFDVDRDRPAGANHGAQTLPRLGLVDDVGDRHAVERGYNLLGSYNLVVDHSGGSLRLLRPVGGLGKWWNHLPDTGNTYARGRYTFRSRGSLTLLSVSSVSCGLTSCDCSCIW